MVKDKKKLKKGLTEFGSGLRKVLMTAATHPATACIAVCSLTTIGQLINGVPGDSKKRQEVRFQLDGLFRTARDLGFACAVAPVAVAGLGAVQAAVSKPKSGYP